MNSHSNAKLSIILPARNEADSLSVILPQLVQDYADAEIIVVDDGSVDHTREVCTQYPVKIISHPYSKGNGAAVKTGARHARGEIFVFMDADGQHTVMDLAALLGKYHQGYDMVVGARQTGSQAGMHRALANDIFSRFASWMVNQKVEDLTSGFRVVSAAKFKKFIYLLPNGFSYPTTITMSFFRAGFSVAYQPVYTPMRSAGKSHIRPLHDGVRFLLIILKIGTLFSPLKLFLPIALCFFLTGAGYYTYTFIMFNRFTNMSALLITTSILVFLIGLISEQITMLNYKDSD